MEPKVTGTHRAEMIRVAELLKVLGHPVRLCILERLIQDGKKNVTEIVSCMDASQSNISQHLSKLRDLKLVQDEKIGNQVYYSCTNTEVCELIKHLFEGSYE